MAKKRAKLYMLPADDLYRRVFVQAHSSPGQTWAKKSSALLMEWGLPDWPAWCDSGGSFPTYCKHLREILSASHHRTWLLAAQKHRVPVPYLQIMPVISDALRLSLQLQSTWKVLLQQRLVERLRCGLVLLGHRSGRPSCARSQICVCCQTVTSHLWAHVFGECPRWVALRADACTVMCLPSASRSWDVMYAVLSRSPSAPGFEPCMEFVAQVVRTAETFWMLAGDRRQESRD